MAGQNESQAEKINVEQINAEQDEQVIDELAARGEEQEISEEEQRLRRRQGEWPKPETLVDRTKKNTMPLSIAGLVLNAIPFAIFLLYPHIMVLLLLSMFPFAGSILGIIALCFGRTGIRPGVKVIAVIAAVWPFIFAIITMFYARADALLF